MKTLIALLFPLAVFAQTSALAPVPIQQPLGNGGQILIGGCLYIYAAGTTTKQDTWNNSDLAGGHKNANPIVLDGSGRAPAIYQTVSVKMVLGNKSLGTCPVTPGTVLWSQDNVFDAGLLAKASLNTFIALLASSAGTAQIGFLQSGIGAVAETVQAKLRQTISVLDFGAVCDGATDDRVKIQAAIAAAVNATLTFPNGRNCAISSPGLTVPLANTGMTIEGLSATSLTAGTSPQGGLISTTASPPSAVLTISAHDVIIRNLYIDCKSAATNALVANEAGGGVGAWTNVTATRCLGDGLLISSSGNNNEIQIVNGNFNNNAGYGIHEQAQANNNDILDFNNNFTANGLGGQWWENGTGTQHFFGHYQGDGGPMITLGTTSLLSGTAFNTVYTLGDQEEDSQTGTVTTNGTAVTWSSGNHFILDGRWNGLKMIINSVTYTISSCASSTACTLTSSAGVQAAPVTYFVSYNVIVVRCDDSSTIHTQVDTSVLLMTGTGACATYAAGTTTTVEGNFISGIGTGQFFKTSTGETVILPGPSGVSKVMFLTAAGVQVGPAIVPVNGPGGGMSFQRDAADYNNPQIIATGTDQSKQLQLGFNTTANVGFIQSTIYGSSANPLFINAAGGTVTIGSSTSTTVLRPPTSCAGLAAGTLWNDTGTLKICP